MTIMIRVQQSLLDILHSEEDEVYFHVDTFLERFPEFLHYKKCIEDGNFTAELTCHLWTLKVKVIDTEATDYSEVKSGEADNGNNDVVGRFVGVGASQ